MSTTIRTPVSAASCSAWARQAGWTHPDGYEIEPKIPAGPAERVSTRVADVCAIDYARLPAADHLHIIRPARRTASQANTDGGETDMIAVADATARAIRAHQGETFLSRTFGSIAYGVPQTRMRLILIARRGPLAALLGRT